MDDKECAIRQLVHAVTGIGLPGGAVWETYDSDGLHAEIMQSADDPDVLVLVWNTDHDEENPDNDGMTILLGCAEMHNFPEWTPEVAEAFAKVTAYMSAAYERQKATRRSIPEEE